MADRAQSEALSFVMVFGIIIVTIGVVFVFGYPGLQQTQDFERVNNAERALTSLADSVDEQVQQGAPSRATEVKLTDASLTAGEVDVFTISVKSAGGTYNNTTMTSRPLVYDSGTGTQLVYSSGLVARQQSTGIASIRDPELVVTSDATVLAIPTLNSDETAIGGRASVLVRTERTDTTPVIVDTASESVSVTVESPRAALWKAYFEQRFAAEGMAPSDWSCSEDDDKQRVTCTFTTGRVYVTAVPIDLSFS